jgi:hypothetical protein
MMSVRGCGPVFMSCVTPFARQMGGGGGGGLSSTPKLLGFFIGSYGGFCDSRVKVCSPLVSITTKCMISKSATLRVC